MGTQQRRARSSPAPCGDTCLKNLFFPCCWLLPCPSLGLGEAFNVHSHNLCSLGLGVLARQSLCSASVPWPVGLRGAMFTFRCWT